MRTFGDCGGELGSKPVMFIRNIIIIPQKGIIANRFPPDQKNRQFNQLYIMYSDTVSFCRYQGIAIYTTIASVTFNCML